MSYVINSKYILFGIYEIKRFIDYVTIVENKIFVLCICVKIF